MLYNIFLFAGIIDWFFVYLPVFDSLNTQQYFCTNIPACFLLKDSVLQLFRTSGAPQLSVHCHFCFMKNLLPSFKVAESKIKNVRQGK